MHTGKSRSWSWSQLRLSSALLALSGVALWSCGGGGGEPAQDGGDPPPDGGGGPPPPQLVAGQVVADLEVVLPASDEFVLHGTLPVPRETFLGDESSTPLVVLDYDGTPLPTQIEIASRYPASSDGADVVELIARVHRDPNLTPAVRAQYSVAVADVGTPIESGADAVSALLASTDDLPGAVGTLLNNQSGIVITSRDCYDHIYYTRPLASASHKQLLRYGPVKSTLRTYDTLLPVAPVSGAQPTLPHMFGVHAYLSTLAGSDVVLLDLRVNNGPDGSDTGSSIDDPVGKVYFSGLEIALPNGWNLLQSVDDPTFGAPYVFNGQTIFPLIEELPDGKLHVMPKQAQLQRRLALCPIGSESRAQSLLAAEGLAFARRGTDPTSQQELWSWWNAATARYFPQRIRLPSLVHMGLDNVRAQLASSYATLANYVINGTGQGVYPIEWGAVGWAHPYGIKYGGMTGGAEIHISQGGEVVEAASPEGYLELELTARMNADRQPNVLFHADGRETRLEDWVEQGSGFQYVDCYFYMQLMGNTDPFGLNSYSTNQIDAVATAARQPSYETDLLGFEPQDMQHLVRNTRVSKALVWIANDPLAKDDLRMQSELVRLSYHPYYNSPWQSVQMTGMLADIQFVAQHPGIGLDMGRGEAWGIDVNNAVYSFSDDASRARLRPWFDRVTETLVAGQANCSGFIQAVVNSKMLDGLYRARQLIEHAIMENAIRGLRETVYAGESGSYAAMLHDVLQGSYTALISPLSWSDSLHGPFAITAVGPLDMNQPIYCASLPNDGVSSWVDNFQAWSSFAYGFEQTGQQGFLDKALDALGGTSLIDGLEAQGLNNFPNRAALLALMQAQTYGLPQAP